MTHIVKNVRQKQRVNLDYFTHTRIYLIIVLRISLIPPNTRDIDGMLVQCCVIQQTLLK